MFHEAFPVGVIRRQFWISPGSVRSVGLVGTGPAACDRRLADRFELQRREDLVCRALMIPSAAIPEASSSKEPGSGSGADGSEP